jgi:hypothetical protein
MKTRLTVVAAIAVGVMGNSADAFQQPYRFSGTVTAVDAPLGSGFSVGSNVSGQVLIESVPGSVSATSATYTASGFSAKHWQRVYGELKPRRCVGRRDCTRARS